MGFLSQLLFFIPFLAFIILSPLPKNAIAQRDLGIPVREPVIWGAYVGPAFKQVSAADARMHFAQLS